jgi:hypothetical protein
MEDRKAVSLSEELHHLIRTVDGIRQLAERLNEPAFHDLALPLSIASNLVIVKERLRLIDRVVRGAVDPWLLWCPENNARHPIAGDSDDGNDVVLEPLSDEEAVRRLRREWRAAKRRLRGSRSVR